jgi:hypothetical protein
LPMSRTLKSFSAEIYSSSTVRPYYITSVNVGIPAVWTGPYSSWIRILDNFLAMDIDIFVPGHGPVGTKDNVRDARDILAFIEDTGRKAYEAGERDPVKVAHNTRFPGKWRQYGEQERMIQNMCALWKELDPTYVVPPFHDLMCMLGDYHKVLNEEE